MERDKIGGEVSARGVLDEQSLERLRQARDARAAARAELRAAVRAAKESGGSVRAVAEVAHLSTRTVQDWLKRSE